MSVIDEMMQAKATLEGRNDSLLEAILLLASAGHIQIIPSEDMLFKERAKPIILLPRTMYNRLLDMVPEKEEGE